MSVQGSSDWVTKMLIAPAVSFLEALLLKRDLPTLVKVWESEEHSFHRFYRTVNL